MQATKDNQDVIHRIDLESSGGVLKSFSMFWYACSVKGTDQAVLGQVEDFHHSDLADAFGLLSGESAKEIA